MKASFFVFSGLFVFALTLCGCVRDEYRPVAEILAEAEGGFKEADKSKVPAGTVKALNRIEAALNQVVSGEEAGSQQVAEELRTLVDVAGYTARPAIDELSKQFSNLDSDTPEAAKKLLVARTYTLLASELKSTSFRLS